MKKTTTSKKSGKGKKFNKAAVFAALFKKYDYRWQGRNLMKGTVLSMPL
jgi:hypothetical protein